MKNLTLCFTTTKSIDYIRYTMDGNDYAMIFISTNQGITILEFYKNEKICYESI